MNYVPHKRIYSHLELEILEKMKKNAKLFQKAQESFNLAKTIVDLESSIGIWNEADQQYDLIQKQYCIPDSRETSETPGPFGGDQDVADLVLSKLLAANEVPKVMIAALELFIAIVIESKYYAKKGGKTVAKELSKDAIEAAWKKAKTTGSYREIVKIIKLVFKTYPKSRVLFKKILAGFAKISTLMTFLGGAVMTGVLVFLMPAKLGKDDYVDERTGRYLQIRLETKLKDIKYAADRALSNAFERIMKAKLDKDCMDAMSCHLVPLRSL